MKKKKKMKAFNTRVFGLVGGKEKKKKIKDIGAGVRSKGDICDFPSHDHRLHRSFWKFLEL